MAMVGVGGGSVYVEIYGYHMNSVPLVLVSCMRIS